MGRSYVRLGRYAAVLLVGCGFAAGQMVQVFHPFSGVASAARPEIASDVIEPADTFDLTGLQSRFESIARKVSPSVVAIAAAVSPPDSDASLRSDDMNPSKLQGILDKTTRTVGTGFVFDSDGYILTNEHVIGDAEQIWVTTDDRKVYPAVVIGSDPRADLAVLKVPVNLPAVSFADFDSYKRGDWTIALGNPFGLATDGEMCMSVGVVSATDRSLPKLSSKENRLYSNLIQTTAQINPGNSGGPLFDLKGNVIGINTVVILPQKQTNGIGFALPVTERLMAELHDLQQGKEIIYGYIGVTVTEPTAEERIAAGMTEDAGVRIETVEEGSPANGVLKSGDMLSGINGETIRDTDEFVRAVGSAMVNQPAQVRIFRGGKAIQLAVVPRRRPLPSVAVTRQNQRLRWQGLLLGPIPANWSDADGVSPRSGLMVLGMENDSPMKGRGITQGSIITEVAGKAIASVAELEKVVNGVPDGKLAIKSIDPQRAVVSSVDRN